MVFKGTIGTDGTAGTALPTTGVKIGDTYKIITAGTYAGQAAKVGDLFIASATTPTWAYVPSGDDTDVTQVTAGAGLNTTGADSSTDGGSITTTGTLNLTKTAVTPGTYQGITVDKYGRVTAAENKGYTTNTGTVTKVTAGTGLTGGDITTSGTIALATSGVTAGTYESVTVDTYGRVTAGTNPTKLQKYVGTCTGNGTTKSFTITHSLNTRDVVVNVYDAASYEEVIVDITRTTTSAVKVDFNVAPATGTNYKVVVIG